MSNVIDNVELRLSAEDAAVISQASKDGKQQISVNVINQDGSGTVGASVEFDKNGNVSKIVLSGEVAPLPANGRL